jgi:hypothetical protein
MERTCNLWTIGTTVGTKNESRCIQDMNFVVLIWNGNSCNWTIHGHIHILRCNRGNGNKLITTTSFKDEFVIIFVECNVTEWLFVRCCRVTMNVESQGRRWPSRSPQNTTSTELYYTRVNWRSKCIAPKWKQIWLEFIIPAYRRLHEQLFLWAQHLGSMDDAVVAIGRGGGGKPP